VFESVLGINQENPDVLREAILRAAASSDDVEVRRDNGHDRDGRPYALVSVPRDKLMLPRDAPDHAVA
jgi:hypothetical protein